MSRGCSIRIAGRLGLAAATLLLLGARGLSAQPAAAPVPAATPAKTPAEEAAACLTAARAGVEDGLYPLAQKQVERYLDFAAAAQPPPPETAEAVGLLMRALHAQKQYAGMLKFMETRGAALLRNDPSALAYWPAVAQYETGDAEKALRLLGEPRTPTPAGSCSVQIPRLRAWCLLRLGRLDEAVSVFDEFLRSAPATDAREKLEWAGALVERGRLAPAAVILNVLAATPGADPRLLAEARFWLGRVAVLENRSAAAIPLLQASATDSLREDLRVDAWINLGRAYQGVTNSELAVAALTNAVDLAREPALKRRAIRALGALYLQVGRLDEAAGVLRPYVAAAPDDPESPGIQMQLGEAYLSGGRWNEADREFQQYMETFTNQAGRLQAQEGRGWALAGAGRHGEAAGAFAKAADLATNTADRARCLLKVGDSYFLNKQYKTAADAYSRLTIECPDSEHVPRAAFQAAESLANAGDNPAAELAFLKLAEKRAGTPVAEEALLRVAEIRQAGKQVEQSVPVYDQIVNTYSNGAFLDRALLGRGLAHYQSYRFQKALDDFQRVSASFPTNRTAEESQYWATMCLYWTGRDDEAVASAMTFIRDRPKSAWIPAVMFWLARHEFNRGIYTTAEDLFTQFVAKMPADPRAADALLWAGRSAMMRQEYWRAIELVTRLVKEYPSAKQAGEARYIQGDALCNLAKFPEAILVLEEMIVKYPDNELLPQAWLRKGDAQFMLGAEEPARYAEAIASFRIVTANSQAPQELALQAEYKIGRCQEKMGNLDGAIDQYYNHVIVRYLADREKGVRHTEGTKVWFTRAALNAADIMESRKEWRQVVTILERMLDAGVPAANETRERIKKIRSEHWWLFY